MPPSPAPSARSEVNQRWLLRLLVMLGMSAVLFYFSWWLTAERMQSPWLILVFAGAILYLTPQCLGHWYLYLAAFRRKQVFMPPPKLSIDVFVTVCGEPKELILQCLSAACNMRGEHRTWLLDDGAEPSLAHLAKRLGAGYLCRDHRRDAKAGNINAALRHTTGDLVVIFDVDHVASPDFLERTLGYFADSSVGFVQVMLTFSNPNESWVAQAAVETSSDFYSPISIGADAVGGATLIGTNAIIRRSALASIGGYQTGLAEDLATSLALHAMGWRSVYVAEPLAAGLVPTNIPSWFTQQLKWARGVFEVLCTAYPRAFFALTWGQRLSYFVRMTYYWVGLVMGFHMVATAGVLLSGNLEIQSHFQQYLFHAMPLAVSFLVIRKTVGYVWCSSPLSTGLLWRPITLICFTWPIYTLAWFMAVARISLAFRPTPKSGIESFNRLWLLPQAAMLALLVISMLYTLSASHVLPASVLLFALLLASVQYIPLWHATLAFHQPPTLS